MENGKEISLSKKPSVSTMVILSKHGKFYQAFGTDAAVLSHLTNYKLTKSNTSEPMCGFPEDALGKVVVRLKDNHISYRIFKGGKDDPLEIAQEVEFPDNRYKEFMFGDKYSDALEFFDRICNLCQSILRKGKGNLDGVDYKLDLTDESVCKNLLLIRDRL